ncbi:hypothetical protein KP509_04G032300 [Ceratopteris richardii]|uniref:Uncharacterized protein n=1 Tax=Ceratopteris richardii TaxID=49495 RepID=A0A8T2UU31_CERRI|nr:hypothetical protein KP509_04G032300 [Ceratopteris richardii]
MYRTRDAAPSISTTNVFAALERKKSNKRKSGKEKQKSHDSVGSASPGVPGAWIVRPLPLTSWADVEEDDDFLMSPLPPLPSLTNELPGADHPEEEDQQRGDDHVIISSDKDESEGCEEEEEEEEGNEENKEPQRFGSSEPNFNSKKAYGRNFGAKEPERQLSKKELKKKGLAELEATLTELGFNQNIEEGSLEVSARKEAHSKGHGEKGSVPSESKSSRRRRPKKGKPLPKEGGDETDDNDFLTSKEDEASSALEKDASCASQDTEARPGDKNKVTNKLSAVKKKKSKDSDSAAKAAAAEAAVRAAKIAAAKRKEKAHYNQHPVR